MPRQIYAVTAVLCERVHAEFPQTRGEASALIERLRVEQGHPAPRLDDEAPGRARSQRRGTDKLARALAAEPARELR